MTCCPPTRVPKLEKSITGTGNFEFLSDDVEVYLSGNKESSKVVVIFPDIFGFRSGRHLGICDFFAENGYYVINPDYLSGDYFSGPLKPYIEKHNNIVVQDIMHSVYAKYIGKHVEKVFMVGFCFGLWIMFHESVNDVLPGVFKAGAGYHPSVGLEGFFGRDPADLSRKIQHPFYLVPTEGDHEVVQPGSFLERAPYNCFIKDCNHQKHGFVSQGDVEKDAVMTKDITDVLNETLKFFSAF